MPHAASRPYAIGVKLRDVLATSSFLVNLTTRNFDDGKLLNWSAVGKVGGNGKRWRDEDAMLRQEGKWQHLCSSKKRLFCALTIQISKM
jgi:hypothetical protein